MTQPPQFSSSSGPLSPQGFPPAPEKKPSKAPKILIILGSVILALSVVTGVALAVIGLGGAMSSVEALTHFDTGQGAIELEAGEERQIYIEEGTPAPSCTIDGPAVGAGTSQISRLSTGTLTWVSVDSFTADEAGEYEITCGDTPVALAPPVSIGGIFAGIGGVLLAIGGGFVGFVLLVIGVILVIVRKRKA